MKRTLTSLLGTLAVAAGLSIFAAPASAYTINCTQAPGTLTAYPYVTHAFKCVRTGKPTVPSNANTTAMAGTVYDMHGAVGPARDGYDKLKDQPVPAPFVSPGVTFYIFANPADYDLYFSERGLVNFPVPPGQNRVFGRTLKLNGAPIWSSILVKGLSGEAITKYYSIQWITGHEIGHSLDYAYRALGGAANQLSDSALFQGLLAQDWINFNALAPCGTGGVFNGRLSLQGLWICSGGSHNQLPVRPDFTPGDNKTILQAATDDGFLDTAELFSNEVSKALGNETGGSYGFSYYFDSSRFGCSQLLVRTVVNTGILPTKTAMAAVAKPGGGVGSAGCPTTGLPD